MVRRMVDAVHREPRPWLRPALGQFGDVLIVATVVFAAALVGILARPLGLLSDLWPANAILMGLMVRQPRLAGPGCWAAAYAAFVAADVVTGSGPGMAMWLSLANMVGVAVTVGLFQLRPADDSRLVRPSSVLVMFAILLASAAAAAAIGGVAGPVYFQLDPASAFLNWYTAELVASAIILPVLLTAPSPRRLLAAARRRWQSASWRSLDVTDVAPALSVVSATALAMALGGPGALAFQVPALLWCAVSYRLAVTVMLTMVASLVLVIAVSLDIVHVIVHPGDSTTISFRLGVVLLALGPLMVASLQMARNSLLDALRHAANHDALTGVLGRSAILAQGEAAVAALTRAGRPFAVMMLDLDGFKEVNDLRGHAAGDTLLRNFARTVQRTLRRDDLVGRLGGDEFVALLPDVDKNEAHARAEQVRRAIASAHLEGDGPGRSPVTSSIGLVHSSEGHAFRDDARLRELLLLADKALYRAKHAGRNCVATVLRPLPNGSGPA